MDDVRAAAERPDENELWHARLAYRTGSPTQTCLWTIAQAYEAEHPADDGEPATNDWAATVGINSDNRDELQKVGQCWVRYKDGRIHMSDGYYCNSVPLADNTRGGVRRFYAALGVQLRAGAGERPGEGN
jgi:hypothetical protein